METIAKIRRAFFVEKKTIKAISRGLKLSRRPVRKAIRSEATEFRYERSVQPKLGPGAISRMGFWRRTRLSPRGNG